MACGEFEQLLLEYSELDDAQHRLVDTHLAACNQCRAFLSALAALDDGLAAALSDVHAPQGFGRKVLAGVALRKPSFVPEILDFVGWCAVFVLAACLLSAFNGYAVWAAGVAFLTAGFWTGLRSYADLKH